MDSSPLPQRIKDLLDADDFEDCLQSLCDVPLAKVLRPLLSALCSLEEKIKWHAVTALGCWVAREARHDVEAGRNILRRLMWMLNEESGGIGWGVPEAMGEILARHEGLAREFTPFLVSYARPNGNFLENERLQAGVAWAIGRLGEGAPEFLQSLEAQRYLLLYLDSPDAGVRGMAAWALGRLGGGKDLSRLEALCEDEGSCHLYESGRLTLHTVGDLAHEAIQRIKSHSVSGP
jgi:hypothetical protein